MFARIIVVVADNTTFDLQIFLSYHITTYPLSLAHCDGAHVKTDKSALLKKLESLQTERITEDELPRSYTQVSDGGLLLHYVLSQTNMGASYTSIARTIMLVVCSGSATEAHVCLDKYVENSIKDSERKLRGAIDSLYVITGRDQTEWAKTSVQWSIQERSRQVSLERVGKRSLLEYIWWKDPACFLLRRMPAVCARREPSYYCIQPSTLPRRP